MDREPININIETKNRPVKSFETEKGSIYTYDNERKTTRFKTATGEQMTKQDLTVFADLNPDEEQFILNAYRHITDKYKKLKVYIGEKTADDKQVENVINKREDIKNSNKLCLFIQNMESNKIIWYKNASLDPKIGSSVFDIRHYYEDGNFLAERHLGHKVTKINY